jgi:hypothetical protein
MREHLEMLEARHANLADENVKRLINHPATVRRRSERDPKAPSVKGEGPAASGGLKAEVARLQEELDKANKRLSQGEGQAYTMADPGRDIIRVLCESPFCAKWLRIAWGLIRTDSDARKLTGGTV